MFLYDLFLFYTWTVFFLLYGFIFPSFVLWHVCTFLSQMELVLLVMWNMSCVTFTSGCVWLFRMQRMPYSRWEGSGWEAGRSEPTGPQESLLPKPQMSVSSQWKNEDVLMGWISNVIRHYFTGDRGTLSTNKKYIEFDNEDVFPEKNLG